MNDIGSPRPPLPRAAPILAIGVAIVLIGGFGLGLYVLRAPSAVLPPAATLSPPPEAILPAMEPPPPEAPAPAPAIAPAPTVAPDPPPPAATRPEPPPAASALAPPPAMIAAPVKPAAEPRHRPAKPVLRHSTSRPLPPPPHKPGVAPNRSHWAIRVGAFQSDDHAKLLVDTLKFHGYPARIIPEHDRGGRGWFVVQTQDYATRQAAQTAARLLTERVHVPTIIFERKVGG
jgi:SPOR domain